MVVEVEFLLNFVLLYFACYRFTLYVVDIAALKRFQTLSKNSTFVISLEKRSIIVNAGVVNRWLLAAR